MFAKVACTAVQDPLAMSAIFNLLSLVQMGCPALGIWVAFLKQADALPGRAPQK
jgi:hypothetical protein